MITAPLDEIVLYDRLARSPLLFNPANFVGVDQPTQPSSPGFDLQPVSASAAGKPVGLQIGSSTASGVSNRSVRARSARVRQIRARPISFPLMVQNVASARSITLIAGLTERNMVPQGAIARYERSARSPPEHLGQAWG
jgi:hypothetical protein